MQEFLTAVAAALAVALLVWCVVTLRRSAWKKFGPLLAVACTEADDGGVWHLATEHLLTDADLPKRELSLRGVRDWLTSTFDAVVLGERRFDLALQSRLNAEVIVTGIEALVESRRPTTFRSSVMSPPAGAEFRTFIGFDLREGADPAALTVDVKGLVRWTGESFFRDRLVTLSANGSHGFGVLSRCGDEVVEWRMRVICRVHGVTRSFTVPPASKPPLVTADATDAGEFWWAGVAGLEVPPYLRRATPEELAWTYDGSDGR